MLKAERRFFGLKTISNQASKEVDQAIERGALASMLNLGDVFELVIDGLMARLRRRILSSRSMRRFFMFLRSLVIS